MSAWGNGYQSANSSEIASASHSAPDLTVTIDNAANRLVLSWPVWAGDHQLETTRTLGPTADWVPEFALLGTNGTTIQCGVAYSGAVGCYYRLVRRR